MKITREFYIPSQSVKVADKRSDAVAYLYTNRDGAPCAMVFVGKRAKPEWRYKFKSETARANTIREVFEGRQAVTGWKVEQRAKRSEKGRGVEVGHILVSSWGYEQTNVDFYQVTKLVGSTMAEIRPIGSIDASNGNEGWAQGHVIPNIDAFSGEARKVRVTNGSFRVNSYSSASIWDGKPCSVSSYA